MEQLLNIEVIVADTQTQIELHPCLHNEPALAEPNIQQTIAQVCETRATTTESCQS